MVFSLTEIIKLQDIDTEAYSHFENQINTFSSKNEDVSLFLKEKAINYENRNKARTFLYLDDHGYLQGYFSLSVKNLDFSKNPLISGSLKKKISGYSAKADSAIVFLIGQLGRDDKYSDHGFGLELLKNALNFLYKAQSLVGIRYCLVETENTDDNKKVIDFYKDYGFSFLQNDKNDNFQQLIIEMKQ